MNSTEVVVRECASRSNGRCDLWVRFLNSVKAERVAELGVYRGDFAARLLQECGSIEKYYMIDPWRHLDHWNKPANASDDVFEQYLSEAKAKTDFASQKRIVLRGTTTEVIDQIPDGELDFAYIDGDHTLKGVAIDLIRVFPKIKVGGWIGGDDFSRTIWQHSTTFEPTLVFPFAVYFAEAVGNRIFSLPDSQFLIEKVSPGKFAFVDLAGNYREVGLRSQFHPSKVLRLKLAETFSLVTRAAQKVKRLISR